MSAIFETCNRYYNILELVDIFPLPKLKRGVTISNKNCI